MSNENFDHSMTPVRSYLVEAFRKWILDNGMTPQIMVDATDSAAQLPMQYVQDGKIVLNISELATEGFTISHHAIQFETSFNSHIENIRIPMRAVLAIYARENGRGMVFEEEEDTIEPPPEDNTPSKMRAKPKLKLVT